MLTESHENQGFRRLIKINDNNKKQKKTKKTPT